MPLKSTTLFLVRAAVLLGLNISLALAQSVAQYSGPGGPNEKVEKLEDNTRRPTVCTEQYAPVCGRINGTLKTYSNQCFARADGADAIAPGACSASLIPQGPR